MKILVVDDEPVVRTLLCTRLAEQGFQVIAAAGGEEGLRKVNEEDPDVVLLDVMMSDIDGFEVCRRIRQLHKGNPRIYFVTALGDLASRLRCFDVGADDVLSKPVDWPALQARLDHDRQLNGLRNGTIARAERGDGSGLSPATTADDVSSYVGLKKTLATVRQSASQPRRPVMEGTDGTDDLLSRMNDGGGLPSERRVVDVNERIRQMTPLLRHLAGEATLDVNLTDRPLEVMLNPLEFGRALVNMVSDAADAVSATNGEIAVRTRRRLHSPSEENDLTAAEWCVIQISDNGCGERREHLTRLLTTKAATGNSALGLALVQNFAASHGGFVSLSAPVEGRGATLAMEIPCLPLNEGHDQ